MGLVYATQFRVFPRAEELPGALFDRLVNQVLSWADFALRFQIDLRLPISSPVPVFPRVPIRGGRANPLPGFSIETAEASAEGGERIWRVLYVIPDDRPNLEWAATASATLDRGEVEFDFTLDVRPTNFLIAPRSVRPRIPTVVRDVIREFDCRAGGVTLSPEPMLILKDDVPSFVENVLKIVERLPVVLLSSGSPRRPALAEEQLASDLAGLAHVFGLESREAEDRLIAAIGRSNACYAGGVRTYWPGFLGTDPDLRHPVSSPERVTSLGLREFSHQVQLSLMRLSSANYAVGGAYRKVKSAIENERAANLEARTRKLTERSRNLDDAYAKNKELADLLQVSEQTRRALEETVKLRDDRISDLENQLREEMYAEQTDELDGPAGRKVPGAEPVGVGMTIQGPPRIHRGENNRRMGEYADEVGGEFVIEKEERCSFCNHINSRFVRRGGSLLCQVCFGKGTRF